ncbi:MAG: universal stress protein [Tepidisphaerales bacterium]
MKLLIAYDGSECADAAIDDLGRAGLPPETDALVVSVADVSAHLAAPGDSGLEPLGIVQPELAAITAQNLVAQAIAEACSTAERAAGRVRGLFPKWNVHTETSAGSPAGEIIQKAEQWKAGLLVVGSHGRSALGRLLFGSVSTKIVAYAPCSVRVVRRAHGAASGPVKIVLGLDGSADATAALRAIEARIWPGGSEVKVVVSVDVRMATSPPASGQDPQMWAQKTADDAVEQLHAAGLAATPVLHRGDPKQVLAQEAEKWGADCIFVGAKGMTRLERFLLGSVSSSVASRAHCSVEVCRGSKV